MEDDVSAEPPVDFDANDWPAEAEVAPFDGESRPSSAAAGSGRKRSVTGALMAGIAMGLRDVFEREVHDRTAIEQPAPEQPTEPQKYEIHLDPIAPEASFAIYRPWLEDPDGAVAEADIAPAPAAAPPPAKPRGGGGAGALGG